MLRADPIDGSLIILADYGIGWVLVSGWCLEPSLLILHNSQKVAEQHDDCDLSNCRDINRSVLFYLGGEILYEVSDARAF